MAKSTAERRTCMSIYDRDNPDSVYSRAPDKIKTAMDQMPNYLKTWSFKKIEKEHLHKFSTRDKQFKIRFWTEYQHSLDYDVQMNISQMCRGLCPHDYVTHRLAQNFPLLAWVLYPVANYETRMLHLHDLSIRKLEEILELNVVNNGKPDVNLMRLVIKVHELVENRVRGIAPQTLNINQRSLNLNHNTSGPINPQAAPIAELDVGRMTFNQLDRQVHDLRVRLEKMPEKEEIVPAFSNDGRIRIEGELSEVKNGQIEDGDRIIEVTAKDGNA